MTTVNISNVSTVPRPITIGDCKFFVVSLGFSSMDNCWIVAFHDHIDSWSVKVLGTKEVLPTDKEIEEAVLGVYVRGLSSDLKEKIKDLEEQAYELKCQASQLRWKKQFASGLRKAFIRQQKKG